MRVLVFGASGLLGSNVVDAGLRSRYEVIGTFYSSRPSFDIPLERVDLRNSRRIREVVRAYSPDFVVNCAAMTDVDACEQAAGTAYSVNGEAPGEVARLCDDIEATFVHISTDYVFDGSTNGFYHESDQPNPIQVYGESKLLGEERVRQNAASWLMIRPSFVYGVNRSIDELVGFPAWVREKLEAGTEVPLFTDQQITPSRAGGVAEVIMGLLESDLNGLYHVACRDCVTPYTFGEELCSCLNKSTTLITESQLDAVQRDATRPKRTCLNTEKVETDLGKSQPTLRDDLRILFDDRKA